MPRIEQDTESWEAGFRAGLAGQPDAVPPDVTDRLAFASGYMEGKAVRLEAQARKR